MQGRNYFLLKARVPMGYQSKEYNRIVLGERELYYELSRKNVKNINLRVHSDLRITVSANRRVSTERINAFVLSKADWILSALDKFESKREKLLNIEDKLYLWGEGIELSVVTGKKNSIARKEDGIIISLKDISDENTKNRLINDFYVSECKQKITMLCKQVYGICKIENLEFPEIKFRSMKSRWGSCNTQKKVLTFNTSLARLPLECAEYVVYHEFTHFLHPNHSKSFYAQLEAYMPDWKAHKRTLNEKGALFN